MTPDDLEATKYLSAVRSALQRYRVPQHAEIVYDLRNHISEATGSGKSLTDVIAGLGPSDHLARAYAMELLINPPKDSRATAVVRFIKILSLVIAGGFFSLCITFTLAILGLSLLAAGLAFIVGGLLQSVGQHPWWINTGNLPPLAVVAIGPLTSLIGAGACWVLWRYVRMIARTLRKMLPAPVL
jgi:uncharacterized membrane protein